MKILPFWCTLSGLTLKGEHYDVAKAHHELEDVELERRLAKINIPNKTELYLKLLVIDRENNIITPEEYDTQKAELTLDDNELDIECLVIQRKYEHITKEQYDYKLIDLKYKDSVHSTDLPFARYELDKKYGKLTEKEFDKAV